MIKTRRRRRNYSGFLPTTMIHIMFHPNLSALKDYIKISKYKPYNVVLQKIKALVNLKVSLCTAGVPCTCKLLIITCVLKKFEASTYHLILTTIYYGGTPYAFSDVVVHIRVSNEMVNKCKTNVYKMSMVTLICDT